MEVAKALKGMRRWKKLKRRRKARRRRKEMGKSRGFTVESVSMP